MSALQLPHQKACTLSNSLSAAVARLSSLSTLTAASVRLAVSTRPMPCERRVTLLLLSLQIRQCVVQQVVQLRVGHDVRRRPSVSVASKRNQQNTAMRPKLQRQRDHECATLSRKDQGCQPQKMGHTAAPATSRCTSGSQNAGTWSRWDVACQLRRGRHGTKNTVFVERWKLCRPSGRG
jgi:hypothetical protein